MLLLFLLLLLNALAFWLKSRIDEKTARIEQRLDAMEDKVIRILSQLETTSNG